MRTKEEFLERGKIEERITVIRELIPPGRVSQNTQERKIQPLRKIRKGGDERKGGMGSQITTIYAGGYQERNITSDLRKKS